MAGKVRMVKNYIETLVDSALKKELAENTEKYPQLCRCPSCLAAVKAAALNKLQPFYVTCIAGEVYGEYRGKELQNMSDVLVAVVKGIEEVSRSNPHGWNTAAEA